MHERRETLNIEHPYWNLYQSLQELVLKKTTQSEKTKLRAIAREIHFSTIDHIRLELLMLLPWFKVSMVSEQFFSKMRELFCYSVLSPKMLHFLKDYSPLVEIGAGNGYNAWLLRQLGADIEAIEAYPVEEGKNWFFGTNFLGLPAKKLNSWASVTKGDTSNLLDHADRTLLMIWPPINSMALDALNHYKGATLILIANRNNCANNAFYKALQNWHLVYSTETDGWSGFQTEWLCLYTRERLAVPASNNHDHDEMTHTHLHFHDEHHTHNHDHDHVKDYRFPHSHEHTHKQIAHSHSYLIDHHHDSMKKEDNL